MRSLLVIGGLVVTALSVSHNLSRPAPAAAPQYSQERLDQLRQSLAAQIAVYDAAEKAMRAPTPQEAANLALSGGGTEQTRSVIGGGISLEGDASTMSALVATIEPDGSMKVSEKGGLSHDR